MKSEMEELNKVHISQGLQNSRSKGGGILESPPTGLPFCSDGF